MKFCAKCGKELQDDARFCGGCGSGVEVISVSKNEATFGSPPLSLDAPPTPVPTPKSGSKTKIIIGLILALLIVAGGFWGWQNFGTEARMQAKLDLAVKYLSENDYEKAILAFNDAIKIDPKEVKAYQGLAKVYTLEGKYDEAKAAYEQGIASVVDKDKRNLQLSLAGMYIDQDNLSEAEKSFLAIKGSDPKCWEACWGLALIYQLQGNPNKGGTILSQYENDNLDDYRAYNMFAAHLKKYGESKNALISLIWSIKLNINQQEAYLLLKEFSPADILTAITDLDNQNAAGMLQFYSYYMIEDYGQALSVYKEKLKKQKDNQKVHILAATAMVKTGDQNGASSVIGSLNEGILNDSLFRDLAEYYHTVGDDEKARQYAIKALQANQTNLEALALLQSLNSENAKTYAAQALVNNWKPIKKIREAARILNIQLPDTSAIKEMAVNTPKGQSSKSSSKVVKKSIDHSLDWDIMQAVSSNYVDRVKQLLADGADPNAKDDTDTTVLQKASYWGNLDCCKLLLVAGANVNSKNNLGGTPLSDAVSTGKADVVLLLLDSGANVNSRDYFGMTPLDHATNSEVKSILLKHGAKHGTLR